MGNNFDLVVIGGGIVGLATALEATRRFPAIRLAVLEKEDRVAAHQSGHNSGVIHSGLYYRPGSEKARLCVEGAAAMVAFCREHGIAHQVCGKVVVATSDDELGPLQELYRRGMANGVGGLTMMGPERLRELEPHAAGIRALHVPGTAITDYAAVTRKYAELVTSQGSVVATRNEVVGIHHRGGAVFVATTRGEYETGFLVNCAGLHSDRIARMAGDAVGIRIFPFRGEYYELARRDLVRGLIYPVPDPGLPFLGVHFTRRVDGAVEAGPNAVLALRREGYRKTDLSARDLADTVAFPGFWRMAAKMWRTGAGEYYRSLSRRAFVKALERLVPEIRSEDLAAGGAGVRAQAVDRSGALLDDFCFVESQRMLHVVNAPSPAATASLVIGREIVKRLERASASAGLAR
ncbi:MAG: L-2-hydroxyglutarate oxidase [Terriglobales bacterium]